MSAGENGIAALGAVPPRLEAPRHRAVGGIAILLIGGGLAAASILGGLAAGGHLAQGRSAQGADAAYVVGIAVPQIVAAIIAGRLSHIAPFRRERASALPAMGWAALGCGGVALAALTGALLGGSVHNPVTTGPAVVLGAVLILLQSSAEEIFLRGWLQPALARYWPPAVAIAATAVLFALLHLIGGARAPLSLVNLALGGVLFGYLAMRSGGLAVPIAAHAGWNIGEQFLIGVDPNPGIGSFGGLIDLDLTGPAWWGGSAEGLNASVAMTLVLAALLVVARYTYRAPAGPRA